MKIGEFVYITINSGKYLVRITKIDSRCVYGYSQLFGSELKEQYSSFDFCNIGEIKSTTDIFTIPLFHMSDLKSGDKFTLDLQPSTVFVMLDDKYKYVSCGYVFTHDNVIYAREDNVKVRKVND